MCIYASLDRLLWVGLAEEGIAVQARLESCLHVAAVNKPRSTLLRVSLGTPDVKCVFRRTTRAATPPNIRAPSIALAGCPAKESPGAESWQCTTYFAWHYRQRTRKQAHNELVQHKNNSCVYSIGRRSPLFDSTYVLFDTKLKNRL